MKRICIFGAGAVGGNMAAQLARAGLQVSVVARGAHLAAIRADGLRLITPDDDFTVRVQASDDPASLGPQDLVVTTLKAHTLGAAADGIAALLQPETPVVFAVNGIPWWYFHRFTGPAGAPDRRLPRVDPDDRLWRTIGPERALGCVIRSPNDLVAPGVVRCNGPHSSFTLGEPDGSDSPRLRQAVAALAPGLPGAQATDAIRQKIWAKLALNVPSSMMAVLTMTAAHDTFANPDTRALYRRLGEETESVAAAYGEAAGFDLAAHEKAATTMRHPPSMLQDLLAGRPLEIDAQLTTVQDLARAAGVATPTLDLLLPLVVQRAASEYRLAAA